MCKVKVFASMLVDTSFPLLWYATWPHSDFFLSFNPTHRLRVCVRREYVLSWCSMLHSLHDHVLLIWFFTSTQQSFSYAGRFFLGLTSTKLGLMCLAQGPQGSDAGEARTRYPSVSSQALYHWATALPIMTMFWKKLISTFWPRGSGGKSAS